MQRPRRKRHEEISWETSGNDRATDGRTARFGHRFAGENSADGILEIVPGSLWPFLSETEIPIVDAAAVDLTQLVSTGNKDGNFGSYGGVGHVRKALFGIKSNVALYVELSVVAAHHTLGIGWIGIDPPEADAIRRIRAIEALDLRNVAIGDGAVGCGEEEHDSSRTGGSESIDRIAFQIRSERLSSPCSRRHAAQQDNDCAQNHNLQHSSTAERRCARFDFGKSIHLAAESRR